MIQHYPRLKKNQSVKPETVLFDFLAKPFAPFDGASEQCLRDSAVYFREVARYTPWALQMYDASVKIPSGIITGNYKQLGNYDECLQVKSGHGFTGKACKAMVQFDVSGGAEKHRDPDLVDLLSNVAHASGMKSLPGKTVIYEWMWCVPSSCNHTEVQEALEIVLDPLKVEGRVDLVVNVPENSCHTLETDRPVFDATDWIYISILSIFAVIIIASTSYDIARQGRLSTLNRKDTRHAILTSFSVYTNGRNLLRTDRSRNSIKCLDGLRYLSICWIICGHTFYCEIVGVKMNLSEVPLMHLNWSNMLLLNANIITDTFFIGLYLHRYMRLTPAYAMMIGFYATLFYKVGTGPAWDEWVGQNRDYCRENWWTNLLYVNNYVNLPRICLSQSWYLATDMQLVWLSPIILYPMLKSTREIFFWIVIVVGFVTSILIPFFVTFSLNLTGTMLYYKDSNDVANVYVQIYTKVYNRYGAYLIGLALGYILYKTRARVIKIRPMYMVSGWLLAAVSGLLVFVGPRWMYLEEHVYDRLEASFYAGLHRQIFTLSISWLIFCCVHGYGGFVGVCLSWKGWVPFSKLTYSAYLCHYVFLLTEAGSVRTSGIVTPMSIFRSYCSNLCLTMLLAAVWSLCFEMPFMTLDRMLFANRKSQSALSTKPNQGKMFGSTDSSKEIYRSTNESSSSIPQACDDTFNRTSNDDSVYSSDLKSHSRDDRCPFIFVIGGPESNNDSWPKPQNVHQNNGFDEDSDDASHSKLEVRLDRGYESIVNEDSIRHKDTNESDVKNSS
ncbi:PREDICTED: LOW QUALITY PROTEIN: nose resistant to fluoxetine protein 6-like [Dufourea novaeangliae]|uniref:LOW QUALITY PROTEIN: nose resistant to fluoxetine protein 6-like n=1 Tax=Dufourea novaeangliae TaxID=178035 RepID=UPI000767DDE0|nr:PREDICTED: LOW QUALITY PROTEIN: nose resistant to fluoxetine protein 6-like [Dufourea novaeangliae]